MVKVGVIGIGKMGVSHLSILGAHADVELVGVCDTSKISIQFLEKYTKMPCFDDYNKMIERAKPDAVFVSVPTKFHYSMVKDLLLKGIHVFVEKPFCLNATQGEELIKIAAEGKLINQVGYHNKFVGTFNEVKKIVNSKLLGDIYHYEGHAYGPVVLRKKEDTWRSVPEEGGGCLMDYASHVIDLVNYLVDPITSVRSSLLKSIFSSKVEDAVYALVTTSKNISGLLSVNWSDETYRKMSTSVTIQGTKGKIISDASELKVFFNNDVELDGYSKGWNIKYITELTPQVDFYLRGEEYSAQIDYFIRAVEGKVTNSINTFSSAWQTDKAIELIKNSAR
ncbi:MAG: Gfo/Idh/MocA family oxidoreductase [Bacteroidota bacterium]